MAEGTRESERADEATFAELLNRHMSLGTNLPPKLRRISNAWTNKTLAGTLGQSEGSVASWRNGRYPPKYVESLELVFFGPPGDVDEYRIERAAFRLAFQKARQAWEVRSKHRSRRKSERREARSFSNQPNFAVRVPRHLYGCNETLAAIEEVLQRRQGPTVLCGMPGVGKTVLAHAYADRNLLTYRLIWQIDASTEETCVTGLVSLSQRLGWTSDDTVASVAVDETIFRLIHEGSGLLLIYENARDPDFLEPYLQKHTDAHILITSNNPAWENTGTKIAIDTWSTEVGTDFLLARANRPWSEKLDAGALSDLLDGLPLAHEQAAAYCDQSGISLQRYRQLFEAAPIEFLSDAKSVPRQYGRTVAKTFLLAIRGAWERCKASPALITCMALLAPKPIPLFVLTRNLHLLGTMIEGIASDKELEDAIVALRAFSLVDRISAPDQIDPSICTDCLTLHRLVREVAGAREAELQPLRSTAFIFAFAHLYPRQIEWSPEKWFELRLLEPHSMHLLDSLGEQYWKEDSARYLFNAMGSYFQFVKKSYESAKMMFAHLLFDVDLMQSNDLKIAVFANNFGLLLTEMQDFESAILFQSVALRIRESHFTPPNEEIAKTLLNLGIALHRDTQLDAAYRAFSLALPMFIECFGERDRDTGKIFNATAQLLLDMGELDGAASLFELALDVSLATDGEAHFMTGNVYHNLALVRCRQGGDDNRSEAVALLAKARTIYANTYGEDDEAVSEIDQITARLLRGELSEYSPRLES